MRQITFALRFTGRAEPVGAAGDVYHAATTAPSAAMVTIAGPDGASRTEALVPGEPARMEADLTLTGETAFQESGTISFGREHRLRFSTIGNGYLEVGADSGSRQGAAIWRVESGDGQFLGARGLFTTNFLLVAACGVVDHHFGVLRLPDIRVRPGETPTGHTAVNPRSREPP